ncbi:TetR/AcrR family transcriptional regulator [Microbacteriaceae bacterium VKM Ac-2855]|nr:TetR/AcrR family transcriptional regulator [Microbacteriaceae bacterium VKM Ac-2855]
MTESLRATRRDATDNRAAIVAAAAALLRSEPDASIEAIAVAAGVTRRTVYGHFASRDALLATVFETGAARIAAALGSVHAADPATEIALIGSRMWREVESIRVNARFALHSPFREAIAAALEPVRAQLRDAVTRGAASGVFRADLDPSLVARLVERAAISVLDEADGSALDDPERLVMVNGLAVAGLSWKAADAVVAAIRAEVSA